MYHFKRFERDSRHFNTFPIKYTEMDLERLQSNAR